MEPGSNLIFQKKAEALLGCFSGKRIGREVEAELAAHLMDHAEELYAEGMPADEAWLMAVKSMGNLEIIAVEFNKESWFNRLKKFVIHSLELKRVAAFSLLFLTLTFSTIFAEKPKKLYKREDGKLEKQQVTEKTDSTLFKTEKK